ncbi:MAG: type II toxin-antitoxin system HicB family antitoxin [Candidatus Eisenbacteria bacterium]|uniref:Type II toxin-antitoxin system HicB family antitoxin n=1 Tax=Eiseniibacteriota bacterium TaxID=2212470 RepID=A0A948WE25_UNCEI|nr:type II toxin-antitoxin system HicB family antitoxin [Candidatus Eisenbacteria bacterium]MBU1949113.1 type II toxin-antitoxin system HicB family antitoxin [Candidatus Eisenbacteria bacterium]MBU2692378.1 type II toxin-antitoxin system HicB family antitoxin [Candidatus Eisenbacteria bacterium]
MNEYSMRIFWSEPDAMFVAVCPEFETLSALGATQEEASRELRVAIDLAIEIYQEDGKRLPKPMKAEAYSGQFRARLPKSLHSWLAECAKLEGVSLNTMLIMAVMSAKTQSAGYHHSEEQPEPRPGLLTTDRSGVDSETLVTSESRFQYGPAKNVKTNHLSLVARVN